MRIFILLAFFFVPKQSIASDLFNCGGIWQNKPCPDYSARLDGQASKKSEPEADTEQSVDAESKKLTNDSLESTDDAQARARLSTPSEEKNRQESDCRADNQGADLRLSDLTLLITDAGRNSSESCSVYLKGAIKNYSNVAVFNPVSLEVMTQNKLETLKRNNVVASLQGRASARFSLFVENCTGGRISGSYYSVRPRAEKQKDCSFSTIQRNAAVIQKGNGIQPVVSRLDDPTGYAHEKQTLRQISKIEADIKSLGRRYRPNEERDWNDRFQGELSRLRTQLGTICAGSKVNSNSSRLDSKCSEVARSLGKL